ncbi:MAG TPA: nucleoside triphosphate pyrophosphohydrolase [Acidisarcina sp.]
MAEDADSSSACVEGANVNAPEAGLLGAAQVFGEAVAIMARLRGPHGCPWDREQNFDSIREHTIEEAYEVLDAIERRNWPDLKDELGDLLLQVLFYSQMAAEAGHFTIEEVIAGLNRKLIRRHPHVFGDEASKAAGNATADALETQGIDAQQVLRNWDTIKQAEKIGSAGAADPRAEGRLSSVLKSMPALMEAAKLGSKAAKVGFDWPDAQGLFSKIEEESAELREAMAKEGSIKQSSHHAVEEELGDLLFTVANLARHLKVEPELALRESNEKFRRRFGAMEADSALPLERLTSDQLEELWTRAKVAEAAVALRAGGGPVESAPGG